MCYSSDKYDISTRQKQQNKTMSSMVLNISLSMNLDYEYKTMVRIQEKKHYTLLFVDIIMYTEQ